MIYRPANTKPVTGSGYEKIRKLYERVTRLVATDDLTVAAASERVTLHYATARYLAGRR